MKFSLVLSAQQTRFEAVALRGNFAENVAKIAAWGYEGVELAVRDPSLMNAAEVERIVSANGLTAPAIGTGQAWNEERISFTSNEPMVRRQAIERVKQHVPLAAHLGALIVIGLIRGMTPAGQEHEQSLQFFLEGMEECSSSAAAEGVRIAIEPLNRYETDLLNTAEEGVEFIHRVGARNLGLVLDTFHMNIEEVDINMSIRANAQHLFHFHVADSDRWYPGAGHIDFPSILNTLHESGYRGFVSGEFLPRPDADTAAQRGIAYLKQIAADRFATDTQPS
jgi:sugar phosphate isomerase/epimerase